MDPRLRLTVGFAALGAFGVWTLERGEGRELTGRYHHLGNDTLRDWPEASPEPEGKRLDLDFDSRANSGEWTLALEQRSIDRRWSIQLNGVDVGRLKPLPELAARSYSLPAGCIRDGANRLSFVPDDPNDDVVIGKVHLIERSLREIHSTQPISLTVLGPDGLAMPARVTIVDASGQPAPLFYAESPRTAVRPGLIYSDGADVTLELSPGRYTSYATRGMEWGCSIQRFAVQAGEEVRVVHRLAREVETAGFIAVDTHLHTLEFSGHGDADTLERQWTLAGEGVELAVATDHNHQTDYGPSQRELELSRFYTTVVGNEVTTKIGHFNAFPLVAGGPRPDHESTDPRALVADMRAKGAQVVVLNHPRWPSYEDSPFTNEALDGLTGAFGTGFDLTVDALEMVNSTCEQADPELLFRDWFALLSRGARLSAVGSSDSHTVGDAVGQGRTYVLVPDSDPSRIDVARAAAAIREGRSSISMGLFIDLRVDGTARMGDTLALPPPASSARASVRVQSPSWIRPRRIRLYANGEVVASREIASVTGATDLRVEFDLPLEPRVDRWLVACVTGDPANGPFWPSLNPYSVAATNPVFLDVDPTDGEGYVSPRETARLRLERLGAEPDAKALADEFARLDGDCALHLLDLLAAKISARGADASQAPAALAARAALAQAAAEAGARHPRVAEYLRRL